MATYEEIYGKRVKEFDSDPTLDSSYEGQVWYDKSSGTLRSVVSFGAWRSGGNLTVPRSLGGISGGTQTASLAYAGYLGGPGNSNSTEEYNGTGWGSGGNVNTARRGGAGLGIQTAALLAGGYSTTPTTFVEEYDGSSWSEVTNTPADMSAGAGTQTAALVFNGTTALYYDGTNWTSSTALPTAMVGGTGLQTAALAVIPPPSGTTTLEWDGSAWTTGGSYNTARPSGLGGMTSGIQTSAISAGTPSSPPPTRVGPITEQYDGTSWATSSATQGTARHTYMTSAANNTAALIAGGSPYTTATEEFDQSINTITPSAWASGTNGPPICREQGTGFGQTAEAYIHGAYFSNPTNTSSLKFFLYNGSTHSSIPNSNNAFGWRGANGSSTSGLIYGGYTYPGGSGPYTAVESYNGSSWSNETAIPIAEYGYVGAGPSETAAIVIAGDEGPTTTHLYDGSSWTSGGSYPFGGYQQAMGGTQTAAIASCGILSPGGSPTMKVDAFEYNGSSWTATGSSLEKLATHAIKGPQTAALAYAGVTLPSSTGASFSQSYDGSVFSTDASMAAARRVFNSGGGTGSSVVVTGGNTGGGSYPLGTEEYSPGTSTITASTLTSS